MLHPLEVGLATSQLLQVVLHHEEPHLGFLEGRVQLFDFRAREAFDIGFELTHLWGEIAIQLRETVYLRDRLLDQNTSLLALISDRCLLTLEESYAS